MIYLAGMSHIWSLLDACSFNGIKQQRSKLVNGQEPCFIDWDTPPGLFAAPLKVASLYIGDTGPHWGEVLAMHTEPHVLVFAPGFKRLIESIDDTRSESAFFVCMHGEEHIYISRAHHDTPYDYYLPNHPELPLLRGRQVIPLPAIQALMQRKLARALANFALIRLVKPHMRLVNIVCPPPVPAHLLGTTGRNYVPSQAAAAGGEDGLRLKNYYTYREMLLNAMAQLDITSLLPPPETVGPDGLLLPDYVADPVHGNARYGSKVLAQMNALLSEVQA